jgi:hypothetical protein
MPRKYGGHRDLRVVAIASGLLDTPLTAPECGRQTKTPVA